MKAIIQTPTGNQEESLAFYTKLGFTILSESPLLVSDGKAIVEINPDRFARAGVKLYAPSWEQEVKALEELTTVVKIDSGYLLNEAGAWIYLIEEEGPEIDLSAVKKGDLGNYAGMSLEVIDMQKSEAFWTALGLKKTMGDVDQGWLAMMHESGFGVSFMKPNVCPHLFFNPSMTYFNGKENVSIIARVRVLNIPITEEITHFNKEGIVDNIIIRDPGGYGFFLFSD